MFILFLEQWYFMFFFCFFPKMLTLRLLLLFRCEDALLLTAASMFRNEGKNLQQLHSGLKVSADSETCRLWTWSRLCCRISCKHRLSKCDACLKGKMQCCVSRLWILWSCWHSISLDIRTLRCSHIPCRQTKLLTCWPKNTACVLLIFVFANLIHPPFDIFL